MSIQVGYRINRPLEEQEVQKIGYYISGRLCDLYGAITGIHRGWAPEAYVIERFNELPLLPRIDKTLEINIDNDATIINCYFARESWKYKFKNKLEKLTGDLVSIVEVEWRIVDIERTLREAKW